MPPYVLAGVKANASRLLDRGEQDYMQFDCTGTSAAPVHGVGLLVNQHVVRSFPYLFWRGSGRRIDPLQMGLYGLP